MRNVENTNASFQAYVLNMSDVVLSKVGTTADTNAIKNRLKEIGSSVHSYKFKWKKAGISFERAVFLFVIGPVLGIDKKRPKHITLDQWVIDFYHANPELIRAFDEAEEEIKVV